MTSSESVTIATALLSRSLSLMASGPNAGNMGLAIAPALMAPRKLKYSSGVLCRNTKTLSCLFTPSFFSTFANLFVCSYICLNVNFSIFPSPSS